MWIPLFQALSVEEERELEVKLNRIEEAYKLQTFTEKWIEKELTEESNFFIKKIICFLSNSMDQEVIKKQFNSTEIIFIEESKKYQKQSKDKYCIDKNSKQTYVEAFKSIKEDYSEIDCILFLWQNESKDQINEHSSILYILQGIKISQLVIKKVILAGEYKDNAGDGTGRSGARVQWRSTRDAVS